jgi:hypothetical protein
VQFRIAKLSAWPVHEELAQKIVARTVIFKLVSFMIKASGEPEELLQVIDVGRDSFDLRSCQTVRNRFHDR